jgi:surface antigen|tara:strand:- start:6719 stop:7276 length:558 start_codon:yes stop_codon:yes gene_type:complete
MITQVKKNLLLSGVVLVSLNLGGCLLPSGINASNGCSPILGCTSKDYYQPGRGVRAAPIQHNKATLGAMGGAAVGAMVGADGGPLTAAAYSVVGLFIGHEIGATLDKIDQIHATLLLQNTLSNNVNGQTSTWKNPEKNVTVNATPLVTNGNCREFVTNITVENSNEQRKGIACKVNGEWVLKELS